MKKKNRNHCRYQCHCCQKENIINGLDKGLAVYKRAQQYFRLQTGLVERGTGNTGDKILKIYDRLFKRFRIRIDLLAIDTGMVYDSPCQDTSKYSHTKTAADLPDHIDQS